MEYMKALERAPKPLPGASVLRATGRADVAGQGEARPVGDVIAGLAARAEFKRLGDSL